MADTITLNPGSGGAVLATDDVGGVHYQLVKPAFGALDAATVVSAADPFPVTLVSEALSGNFDINIAAAAATVTVSDTATLVDDAAFTPAVSRVMMMGATFDDTAPDSVTEGDGGAIRMSGNRNLHVTLRDAAGNERGLNINGSGQASVSVDNTPTVTVGALPNEGQQTMANSISVAIASDQSALAVADGGGSLTVDGTVTVNAGTGTFTVDQANLADIDYDTGAGTATQAVIGIALPAAGGPVAGGTATNPIRMDPTGTTTQPVSDAGGSLTIDNAALSVVGGGAEATALRVTLANDSTGVLAVDDNGGSLTIDNAALAVTGGGAETGALRVTIANDSTGVLSVDDGGGTLTVDGTVAVSSIATSVTPGTAAANLGKAVDAVAGGADTGIAVLAVRDDALATLTPADADYTQLRTNDRGALWVKADGVVSIDDNAGSLTVDGTVTVSSISTSVTPGTGAADLGKAVDAAAGGTDTGVATLAVRDDTLATLTPVDGDYTNLRTNSRGAQWVVHDGTMTVSGTVTAANVAGDVAHDAADSGAPVKVGAVGRTTHPAAVADGDRVNLYADTLGRLVTCPWAPLELIGDNRVVLSSTTETQLVATGGAGIKRHLMGLIISNESGTEVRVDIADGAAVGSTTDRLSIDLAGDGGGAVAVVMLPLKMTTDNHIWTAQLSAAVSSVYITAWYFSNN